jgi:hypothetical protein
MFELIIRAADGSIYWSERFNSQSEAQKWLAEEQTRKYWKPEFTTQIIDHTPSRPAPPTQDEIDAENQRLITIATLKQRLKVLAAKADVDVTAADLKEAIFKLIKMKVLTKELD